jgi:ArsR family transcriptional regulator
MALLEEEQLTVAELVTITELAQSSVSTHLGKLRDAGLLLDRRLGASTLYTLNDGNMPRDAKLVWSLVRGEIKDAVLDGDKGRCADVIKARESTSAWPDAVAGQMERYYSPGRTWEATARGLVGLMKLGHVLDAGSGDGTMAQLLAPRAKSVTCLDRNEKMVEAARGRLAKCTSCRSKTAPSTTSCCSIFSPRRRRPPVSSPRPLASCAMVATSPSSPFRLTTTPT